MTEQTLSGITVLLTRPVEQSAALASALRSLGASVCELPLIEIEEVTEEQACGQIKSLILNLDHYTAAILSAPMLPVLACSGSTGTGHNCRRG